MDWKPAPGFLERFKMRDGMARLILCRRWDKKKVLRGRVSMSKGRGDSITRKWREWYWIAPGLGGEVWKAGGGEKRPEAAVGPGMPK
jgi:hypothetical protein